MSETPVESALRKRTYADTRHRYRGDGTSPEHCALCGLQRRTLPHESRYPGATVIALALAVAAAVAAGTLVSYVLVTRAPNRAKTKAEIETTVGQQVQAGLCALAATVPGVDERGYERAHHCAVTLPIPAPTVTVTPTAPTAEASAAASAQAQRDAAEQPAGPGATRFVVAPAPTSGPQPGQSTRPPAQPSASPSPTTPLQTVCNTLGVCVTVR